ncbi:DNA-processing protein DprA [Bacillus sp. AK031]
MNSFRNILFALQHCDSIGWKSIYLLLKHTPTPTDIPHLSKADLRRILPIPSSSIHSFYEQFHSFDLIERMNQYQAEGIGFLTIWDEEYPKLLQNIYDPPWVLFYTGDHELLLREKKLAIVGSRKADEYTVNVLSAFLPKLVDENIVIVSGLAAGADGCAHRQTIELGGKTIAVIAGGFHHIYPASNRGLAQSMKKTQLLVSEYPPCTKPRRWHFPMRNRIISGLSQAVLVTQASRKSGSLITADFALNEGRDIFALPGPVHSPLSEGSNHLIQQGAKLIAAPDDIISEYKYK